MSELGARAIVAVGIPLWIGVLAAPAAARDRGADGRFDQRRSAHFVLRQDVDIDQRSGWRGSVRFEKDVLQVLERAYDELDRLLGLRPRRAIAVWVYDPARFDAAFAGLFRFPAAGFYHGAVRVRGDPQLTPALQRVLHHELVHAAIDAEAPSYAPPGWVNEGVAEWFENRALGKRGLSRREWAALAAASAGGAWIPIGWLSLPNFARIDPQHVGLAYLQSYATIDHLVALRGERGLARFLEALFQFRDPDRALSRTYRLDVAELQQALRAKLH